MPDLHDRVQKARVYLEQKGLSPVDGALVVDPELAPVLALDAPAFVSFASVPGFPPGSRACDARVEGGEIDGVRILAIRGRVFGYEGIPLRETTIPIRVARAMGAKWIVLAGAADALEPSWNAGDLIFSTDQLNWMGDNPLIGPHDERLGVRFLDMSCAYDVALLESAEKAAKADPIGTKRGIYAGIAGPQRATAAERRMLRSCGADLAGMSAVAETIVAVHSGMKVLGISVLDEAKPGSWPRVAGEAAPRIDRILRGVLKESRMKETTRESRG